MNGDTTNSHWSAQSEETYQYKYPRTPCSYICKENSNRLGLLKWDVSLLSSSVNSINPTLLFLNCFFRKKIIHTVCHKKCCASKREGRFLLFAFAFVSPMVDDHAPPHQKGLAEGGGIVSVVSILISCSFSKSYQPRCRTPWPIPFGRCALLFHWNTMTTTTTKIKCWWHH
jgi:hypothetical protein